jgi:DNA polymerase III subunit epsilon
VFSSSGAALKYLFIDTETTGLPKRNANPITNPEKWPRMVQIAWMLCDEDEQILDEQSHIIYPEGYVIPDIVARIHGITTARAKKEGKPLIDVLSRFTDAAHQSDLIIGHNIGFDRGVITAEYKRTEQDAYIYTLSYFCTMKETAEYCKIPYPSGRKGNKWPKLMELYQTLFSCPFEGAHDAHADVQACVRCYFELKRRGCF